MLQQLGIDPKEERGGLLEFGPLRGVARGDMCNLVRHHRGDLGRVVGEGKKPAGDEDVPGRQGEGVDDG